MDTTREVNRSRIMLVEDERQRDIYLEKSLINMGYDICAVASSAEEAFMKAEQTKPSLALMDISLSSRIDRIYKDSRLYDKSRLPVVYMTDRLDKDISEKFTVSSAYGFVYKPYKNSELRLTIESALSRYAFDSKILSAKKQLESTVDRVPVLISLIDEDFNIIRANKEMSKCLGLPFDQLIGSKCYKSVHGLDEPPEFCVLKKNLIRTNEHIVLEMYEERLGCHFEETIVPMLKDRKGKDLSAHIYRDITKLKLEEEEKRVLSESLFQKQKNEAVNRLAGGLAHKFNNLLMIVMGNAEILKRDLYDQEELIRQADNIKDASREMADLTKQMLLLAKTKICKLKPVLLNREIENVLQMSRGNILPTINLETELAIDLWPVKADKKHLTLLLDAVFSNALEAIPESGGKLMISACNRRIKNKWQDHYFREHQGGDYVEVNVSDNGAGIARDIQPQIFDPFFSTKFTGRGIGLALADRIIEMHKGSISVKSKEEQGTSITIRIPRLVGQHKDAPLIPQNESEKIYDKILIVDDEVEYLAALSYLLEDKAKEVVTVEEGLKAVDIFSEQIDRFDLVILDIHLNDSNGRDIYKKLRELSSDVIIMISTGYDEETALEDIILTKRDSFIQKPFDLFKFNEKLDMIGENSIASV